MKLHRPFTVLALCVILFSVAVPLGPVTAAQSSGAELQVTITPDASSTNTGHTIGFVITVFNTSSIQAENLIVKNNLDPAVTWQVDDSACSISSTGLLTCNLGSLPGGESVQVHVVGKSSNLRCNSISNTVTAQAKNALPAKDNQELVQYDCISQVKLEKTAAASEVQQGQPINFTLDMHSYGRVTALNVTLRDVLPVRPGLSWSIAAPAPSACEIVSGELVCNYGSVWSGDERTVTITSLTGEGSCGLVRNSASVESSNEPESEWGNNTSTAEVNVICPPGPQLSITKTADASEVIANGPLGYTISVSNTGSGSATDVVIEDQLAAGLVWSETTGADCAVSPSQVLTCTIPSIAANASASVHVTAATVPAICGLIKNTATVEAANFDQVSSDEVEVTVVCPQNANVAVIKFAEVDTVSLDGLVQFTLTVSNTSAVAAQNVILEDVLPATTGLAWSIDDPAPLECAIEAGVLTCEFGTLEAGASRSVSISSIAGAGSCGLVSNTATVSATGELEENLIDNTANASVSVACEDPVLEVVKVADAGMVNAPGAIGYTITINNTGSVPATDVTLEDQLASGLDWSETSGADCSFSETKLMTCSIPVIAASESISVHVTASTNTTVCGEVSNTAYAVAANHDQVTSNPVVVDVICGTGVNVKIAKTAQKPVVNQGEPILFTMLVSNDGAETAQGVVLKDTLPTVAGLAWSIVAPVPSGCAIAANTLTCNFGAIEPAQSRSVQITSPSNNTAGVISNTGRVTATNETAGNEADNQSTAQVQVPIAACLNLNLFNGIYANTFEGAQPGKIGIQNYRQSVAPKGQQFLGDYGNQTVSLTVGCLPPHNRLLVEFDLYILRSWDGNTPNTGPDRWKMELVGRNTPLIDTTFSNWSWSRQAYPGSYPTGDFPYLTGSVGRQTLGYIYDSYRKDTTYHLSMFVAHTGELATFNFTGLGLQQLADESWGIDNITVVPAGLNTLYIPEIHN